MKERVATLICILFFFNGCAQAQQEKRVIDNKQQVKRTYFANYDFSGYFNIIFNGVSMARNRKDGVISGIEYLNPYISNQGFKI